jgi:hypothetical protein
MANLPSIFNVQRKDYIYRVSIIPVETLVDDPKTFTQNKAITFYNVNLGDKNKCVF